MNSVFVLFDCFGAILYELLIAGLINMVFQSGAYEAFAGVLVNKGNVIYFREQRKKGQISRGTETILGNREFKKTKFEGTEEQANLFQRNKKTCTPPPPPLRGLRISLRRQNTTKVMAYIITRNSPFKYKQ